MIKQLVEYYLQINPNPSDAQVHNLADALGIDKETLESEMYEMLSECVECTDLGLCAAHRLVAVSEFEQRLQDQLEDTKVVDSLITVNDGEESPEAIEDLQLLLKDDNGIEPESVQQVTQNDGV